MIVLILGASSCSSPSHGLVAFETAASLGIVPNRHDSPRSGGSPGFGGPVDDVVPSVGFGVSLNSSAIDVIAIAKERLEDSEGRSEIALGVRKRLPDKNGAMGYVHAAHRMGQVDHLDGEDISSGIVFGFGVGWALR